MGIFERITKSNFTNNPQGDLQFALEEVLKKTYAAFYESTTHLDELRRDVVDAKKIIDKFEKEFKQKHFNSNEIVQILIGKFDTIKREFDDIVATCTADIGNKRETDSKFNITLFGRTMAGKSTLMSILTHGNDDKIGKGAQRTTTDVWQYDWNGMRVTDVPGIDAYEGDVDDETAYVAAKNADLILFIITAGQPESTEAKWLIKLKKEDKPLICLCNWKSSLEDERLDMFIKKPELFKKYNDFEGIKKQFNAFIQSELPNEHIDIVVAHLQAVKKAELQNDETKKAKLLELSKFKEFEQKLIDDVRFNALFYRQKSYLSIIDTTMFQILQKLFDSSAEVLKSKKLIEQKHSDFEKWSKRFVENTEVEIQQFISEVTYPLYNSVHDFAMEHVDNKDANDIWNKKIKSQKIAEKVQNKYEEIVKKCVKKTNEFFTDLNSEIKLRQDFSKMYSDSLDSDKEFNWRKLWGWTATGAGTISGIVAGLIQFGLIASNPVGWVCGGIALLVGVFSFFTESEAEKKRKAIEKIEKQLNEHISKIKKEIQEILKDKTAEARKEIFKDANDRFSNIMDLTETLAKSHRDLALEMNKEHIEITKKIFDYAKESYKTKIAKKDQGNMMSIIESLTKGNKNTVGIGRIPGKHILIAVNDYITLPDDLNKTLGNNDKIEQVVVKGIGRKAQLESAAQSLLGTTLDTAKYPKGNVVYATSVIDSSKKDYINLLQQIFNTQIVTK